MFYVDNKVQKTNKFRFEQVVQVLLFVCMQNLKSYTVKGRSVEFGSNKIRVPTRTGKPGKMGRHFPVREKSGNFEQTGKVREKCKVLSVLLHA